MFLDLTITTGVHAHWNRERNMKEQTMAVTVAICVLHNIELDDDVD